PIYANREDGYEVSVKFRGESFRNRDDGTVEYTAVSKRPTVTLKPYVGISGPVPKEGTPPALPEWPPLTFEVGRGDWITVRNRSHKVLNVVPPQDIDGVGHLVGWIELAPNPVEPPETPQAAKK